MQQTAPTSSSNAAATRSPSLLKGRRRPRRICWRSDWLAAHGVTQIAMEGTGVYWKCVYYVLEEQFELWLVNAQHVKNVPGRKTDTSDAAWLCGCLSMACCARALCRHARSASFAI